MQAFDVTLIFAGVPRNVGNLRWKYLQATDARSAADEALKKAYARDGHILGRRVQEYFMYVKALVAEEEE
jgi:hypothetical protein